MALVLHGFRYSVYVRVARVALAEKALVYEHVEIDPFAPDMPTEYLDLHPFRRVPTLVDGDVVLYETGAGRESKARSFEVYGCAFWRANLRSQRAARPRRGWKGSDYE